MNWNDSHVNGKQTTKFFFSVDSRSLVESDVAAGMVGMLIPMPMTMME